MNGPRCTETHFPLLICICPACRPDLGALGVCDRHDGEAVA